MKREEIKAIFSEATDEQLNAIMDLNGKDIEKAKGNLAEVESELEEKRSTLESLSKEINTLKSDNAAAGEYKKRLEELEAEIAEKREKREAEELEKAERAEFDSYFKEKGKEWTNPFIADGYFGKFREAKKTPENKGKMSADILHDLTKDDATAFKGVSPDVKLKGADPISTSAAVTKEEFKKMGYNEKAKLFSENPDIYNTLKGE